MRRVMYLFLPDWPIDRLRRLNKNRRSKKPPGGGASHGSAAPADEAAVEPPFATVITAGGCRLLAAVSPAAASAGLAQGMKLADALSFLPGLATIAAEPDADAAALTRLAEWCGRYSPWTAPNFQSGGGTDGIKIEITGCAHLWGGEAALAADLARHLARQKIAHRIAVAGTLGAAWALARFAAEDGRPALPTPDAERAALAPLPVEALRLDPATVAGLRRVGLRRVGELYPMPRAALARRFGLPGLGNAVARRLDQALGHLPEPLMPLREAPVRRVRLSFAEPIADPADLARAIERLAADLAARLAREGIGARRCGLAFHRVDGTVEHIRLGIARPSRDPRHLAGLLTAKLETVDPGLGVEDMILALFAVENLPAEQIASPLPGPPSRAEEGNPRSERVGAAADTGAGIAELLDRIGARFGLAALSRIAARESHIPERASVLTTVASRSPPQPHPPPRGEGRPHGGGVGASCKPPRPIRLFAPPELIEAAWLLPDDPPFRFTWRRRAYRVCRADGPERIADEWWTEGGSLSVDAIRDYYGVEDEEGRRFWIFRAGPAGDPPPHWFLHGVFA